MNYQLRKWSTKDIDALVKYANNKDIANNLTNQFPHPYTIADGIAFINIATQHEPTRIFCISINGEACGAIGVHPQQDIFCKNAELGYWLAEPYWGKGIMTRVVKEMVDYGFQHFDIDRIFARPFGGNIGSQKILQKAGFTLEATLPRTIYKNGAYQDELIFAIRK